MPKIFLTREKIKQDYKEIFRHDLLSTVKYIALLTVILIFAVSLYSLLLPPLIPILIGVPLYLLMSGLLLVRLFKSHKSFRLICENKFRVITDRLVKRERKTYSAGKSYFQVESLIFESFGEYTMPDKQSEIFDNQFDRKNDEIYESAFVGDEFYLILVKNKIVYVYNTKLFELQE